MAEMTRVATPEPAETVTPHPGPAGRPSPSGRGLRASLPQSLPAPASRLNFTDSRAPLITRDVPVETPVNIIYAPVPFAVMMATPADLEDFAYGFSFTEGIIEHAADIRSVAVEEEERGLRLVITLAGEKMRAHLSRARNIAGRTGCGLCGIDDLASLPHARAQTGEAPLIDKAAIARALADLEKAQPLNALTHAVHGAAWCPLDGGLQALREDVGRHNALDKLIGALLRADAKPDEGFVLITSRCSFEMVEKCAAFGARTLVAISAPTSLALERASAYGMTLIAVARADGALVFNGQDRISSRGAAA